MLMWKLKIKCSSKFFAVHGANFHVSFKFIPLIKFTCVYGKT